MLPAASASRNGDSGRAAGCLPAAGHLARWSGAPVPGPATASPVHRRIVALCALVALLMCSPLLAGCLKRSTTVGDRFSGSIVAASSPDNPAGTPQIDVPDSMTDQVSVSEFSQDPKQNADSPKGNGTDSDKNPAVRLRLAGTKASFVDLTMGQLAQLERYDRRFLRRYRHQRRPVGDATRRHRAFRGTADLTGLLPNRDYLELNLTFGGPISATNGEQLSDNSVTWSPTVGEGADFTPTPNTPIRQPPRCRVGRCSSV